MGTQVTKPVMMSYVFGVVVAHQQQMTSCRGISCSALESRTDGDVTVKYGPQTCGFCYLSYDPAWYSCQKVVSMFLVWRTLIM